MYLLPFLIFAPITRNRGQISFPKHGVFLEGVYEVELDTKTEYAGF
jgi:hypothetical protein